MKVFAVILLGFIILNANTTIDKKTVVSEFSPDMGTLETNGVNSKDYTNIDENITSVFNRLFCIPEGQKYSGNMKFRIPTQTLKTNDTLKSIQLVISVITGGDKDYVGSHSRWQFSVAIGGEEFPIVLGIDEFGTEEIKMFEAAGKIWIQRTWILDLTSSIDVLYIRDLNNRLLVNFQIQPWGDQYYTQNPSEGSGWNRPFFINQFSILTEYETENKEELQEKGPLGFSTNYMVLVAGYVGFLLLFFFSSFFLFRRKNKIEESIIQAGKRNVFKF